MNTNIKRRNTLILNNWCMIDGHVFYGRWFLLLPYLTTTLSSEKQHIILALFHSSSEKDAARRHNKIMMTIILIKNEAIIYKMIKYFLFINLHHFTKTNLRCLHLLIYCFMKTQLIKQFYSNRNSSVFVYLAC